MTEPGLYLAKVLDKVWGLYLVNQSTEKYVELKRIFVHREMDNRLHTFLQSDSDRFHDLWEQEEAVKEGVTFNSSFLFIEFWTDDQDLILSESIKIANKLNMELRTDFY